MKTIFETNNVFVLGHNVDTDAIIPARHLVEIDPVALGGHCLEDMIENLQSKTENNGLIVAGSNFGSGSSREHAPLAMLGAGIRCVVAESFARIFFRNAFNVGLPLMSCPGIGSAISSGEQLRVDITEGTVESLGSGKLFKAEPIEPFMIELLEAGGLINRVSAKIAKNRSK